MPDRRTLLLDAAITLLGNHGVRAVTHRAVDAQAELPAGSTSNYFRTRDNLLAAVVGRFAEREMGHWESIARAADPRTIPDLAATLGAMALASTGPQRTLTLARYALLVEGAQYPALRPPLASGGARVNLYFENWLLRVGSVDPERDMRIVANFLTGRILHDLALPDPDFDPIPDLAELLGLLLDAAPPDRLRRSRGAPTDLRERAR